MENQLVASVVTVLTAIVGLAIIAVLVGNRAQTANVVEAISKGFAADIGAAVAPVTGSSNYSFN